MRVGLVAEPDVIACIPACMNKAPHLGLQAENEFGPVHTPLHPLKTKGHDIAPNGVLQGGAAHIIRKRGEAVAQADKDAARSA